MKIHLVFGLITVVLLVIVIGSRRQKAFSFDYVANIAETMAREDYLPAVPALPKNLRNLTAEQYKEIQWRDEKTLWRKEGLPFQVRFFHSGYLYDRRVEMFLVSDKREDVSPFRYSSGLFNLKGDLANQKFPDWIGFAGFRLYHPFNKPDALDELLAFLGGSNFQVRAKDLVYGASGSALVVNPQDTTEPETPAFTAFFLKRPDTFATEFRLYALMESRNVTGAYQFDIEAGAETRVHVRARLFFKRRVSEVGFAPLHSMFWFGENTSNTFGDFRPEVHKSDGLLLQKNNGEWLWHPLAWSTKAQVNVFTDAGRKGYGLFQRDRDFNHYQDLNSVFHKMASVWVQPVKGFEGGSVKLIQQPTKNEDSDNVLAYWEPTTPPEPLRPVDLEYVLRWVSDAHDLPPLGRCVSTRVDFQEDPERRQFFLDFTGGALDRLKQGEIPMPEVASPTGAAITECEIKKNDFNRSWRVNFFVSTKDKSRPTEVLCRLMLNGTPVTETWTYTWQP